MKLSLSENRLPLTSNMLLLVFAVLLGTVVTVNSAQPDVELFTEIVHLDGVSAENGMSMKLVCRARGFITSDVFLNIKKKGFILSRGDGVETSGVKPDRDKTFWRRDHVIIPHSEVSDYSCEVVHASSSFRVEKVWDPDSGGKGRIISSEFIDTTKPEVKMFTEYCNVEKNVFLLCEALGFYPHHITVNIKRNGTVLTKEDGVDTSDLRPNGDDGTFQIRRRVEIGKSDPSVFSCEVIHDASGSRVEKVWAQPEVEMFTDIIHLDDVSAENGMAMMLVCRVRGFVTSDVTLNIKKKGFIQSKGDGVETSGVKQHEDKTYWRRDHVIIPHSEVSDYSCEVVHAASRFRVEKVSDPDSDEGGRIISSEFIATTPPEVKMFIEDATVEKNVFLLCEALGFYPHNITVNIRRNGHILTREDGVKSSGVRPNGNDTFQRRDGVEIKKSEMPLYRCEVIHNASGSRVEKFWGQPHVKLFAEDSKVQTNIILTCLASGFYPNNIIIIMKRNGRILTREDGVERLDVSPIGQRTFQRGQQVEILKSDKSDYSCEVIHYASGSHVEKFWDHHLAQSGGAAVITGPVVGVLLLVLVVVLVVLWRRGILGAAKNETNNSSGTSAG